MAIHLVLKTRQNASELYAALFLIFTPGDIVSQYLISHLSDCKFITYKDIYYWYNDTISFDPNLDQAASHGLSIDAINQAHYLFKRLLSLKMIRRMPRSKQSLPIAYCKTQFFIQFIERFLDLNNA